MHRVKHSTAKKRTRRWRQLQDQLGYRDQLITRLRAENTELRTRLDPKQVFNCTYPAQMMALVG